MGDTLPNKGTFEKWRFQVCHFLHYFLKKMLNCFKENLLFKKEGKAGDVKKRRSSQSRILGTTESHLEYCTTAPILHQCTNTEPVHQHCTSASDVYANKTFDHILTKPPLTNELTTYTCILFLNTLTFCLITSQLLDLKIAQCWNYTVFWRQYFYSWIHWFRMLCASHTQKQIVSNNVKWKFQSDLLI